MGTIDLWSKVLEVAAHVTNPVTTATLGMALAALLLFGLKGKRPAFAWVLSVGVVLLALSPLLASVFIKTRNLYHVRIVVRGVDLQPLDDADVSASTGGEVKKASRSWEYDIAPQAVPEDGKVIFFASLQGSYLLGSSVLRLGDDYHPTVEIQLAPKLSTAIRGVVVDGLGRSVPGAHVSTPGYPDMAITDQMGNFVLPSHYASGQTVAIRAEKGQTETTVLVVAGQVVQLVLRRK
ncbi:MAG: carboxypeptidase-like regulatory domain-containing protein [Janthinobacterium lividum]